jgi:hypothetical protein
MVSWQATSDFLTSFLPVYAAIDVITASIRLKGERARTSLFPGALPALGVVNPAIQE